jgi:hypothetical protein
MTISVFPIPTTVTDNAITATIPANLRQYKAIRNVDPGIYTISCTSATIATVTFVTGTSSVEGITSSGSVQVNLSTAASEIYYSINTGTNVLVTITKVAAAINTGEITGGTLDTVTTTSTYNETGKLYVVCVGGGAAGAFTNNISSYGTLPGGQGGSVTTKLVYVNNATSITIGAAGTTGGVGAGTTSFGNLVSATGGSGGAGEAINNGLSVKSGNNGAGGAGKTSSGANPGFGSGIGTGGAGATANTSNALTTNGQPGTGYGAGGGGSLTSGNVAFGPNSAGNGTAGVVYVLRGFN